jgi:ABC-type antimicrobial peptide transport system permease subunit
MELGVNPLRLAARLSGVTPEEATGRIREIAAEIAPGFTFSAATLDAVYDNSGNQEEVQFLLALLALITLAVLLLSAGGISALMSFAVTKRQREIGIRTALGASRGQMITSIFTRSARQLGAGLGVGLVGTAILDRVTGGSLLRGRALLLLAGIAALMIAAGLLATLGPARRALRVQPMEALREE